LLSSWTTPSRSPATVSGTHTIDSVAVFVSRSTPLKWFGAAATASSTIARPDLKTSPALLPSSGIPRSLFFPHRSITAAASSPVA
jgi:hypothetical protein